MCIRDRYHVVLLVDGSIATLYVDGVAMNARMYQKEDQTGLDTLVVHTVNDEYSLFAIYGKRPSESVKYSTCLLYTSSVRSVCRETLCLMWPVTGNVLF